MATSFEATAAFKAVFVAAAGKGDGQKWLLRRSLECCMPFSGDEIPKRKSDPDQMISSITLPKPLHEHAKRLCAMRRRRNNSPYKLRDVFMESVVRYVTSEKGTLELDQKYLDLLDDPEQKLKHKKLVLEPSVADIDHVVKQIQDEDGDLQSLVGIVFDKSRITPGQLLRKVRDFKRDNEPDLEAVARFQKKELAALLKKWDDRLRGA